MQAYHGLPGDQNKQFHLEFVLRRKSIEFYEYSRDNQVILVLFINNYIVSVGKIFPHKSNLKVTWQVKVGLYQCILIAHAF